MSTAVIASDSVNNRQLGLLTDATNVLHQRRCLLPPDARSDADKVKRCLFGVPDHGLVAADLNALRRQLDAQSRQRWNFDFRSGAPLTSLPVSTVATSETHLGARWVWSRVGQSLVHNRRQSVADCPVTDTDRRPIQTQQTHRVSLSPRRHPLLGRPNFTAVKRRRMSLTPSVEVKGKLAGSEVKAVSCRRLPSLQEVVSSAGIALQASYLTHSHVDAWCPWHQSLMKRRRVVMVTSVSLLLYLTGRTLCV